MALPRLVLILLSGLTLTLVLTFVSLIHSHPRQYATTGSSPSTEHSNFRSLFSFRTPSALFPSSAIISLTDDNSTFFLARPADFGPSLPANGLSGQLWVGSGFGDDNLGRGLATDTEGELGCSDVPGWRDGRKYHQGDGQFEPSGHVEVAKAGDTITGSAASDRSENTIQSLRQHRHLVSSRVRADDGTDDHLHHPLPATLVSRSLNMEQRFNVKENAYGQHADIQSLQEGAEISGKLVLLSRGGCGFLEKVKWVQRRGGAGLIVGDNTRGGALVTMYAKGDTSNVTIPALFTSRTTAHLLSSLIPPEALGDGGSLARATSAEAQVQTVANSAKLSDDRPTFTPTAISSRPTSSLPGKAFANRPGDLASSKTRTDRNRQGWFSTIFRWKAKEKASSLGGGAEADSRRPPSSGRLTWVNEQWTESAITPSKKRRQSISDSPKGNSLEKHGAQPSDAHIVSGDGFQIGVHDWRDPDLVGVSAAESDASSMSKTVTKSPRSTALTHKRKGLDYAEGSSGGSITPSSGEYQRPAGAADSQYTALEATGTNAKKEEGTSWGWLGRLGWGSPRGQETPLSDRLQRGNNLASGSGGNAEEHEGLWVTLTPTTMSTSPFFDTLLVLVVSPLITLTVVYSLLLIRSRIRRRRWRAPKSVVDRLPIRTYHTMSSSSTTSSSQLGTPMTSSPTSPLLQHSPRVVTSRPRPRSRTASGVGGAVTDSLDKATAKASLMQGQTKTKPTARDGQYHGKQVECVVCLEEYVDGQSKVMSLPCGHEFHAECM